MHEEVSWLLRWSTPLLAATREAPPRPMQMVLRRSVVEAHLATR